MSGDRLKSAMSSIVHSEHRNEVITVGVIELGVVNESFAIRDRIVCRNEKGANMTGAQEK